jgi:hypothetical protein
MIKPNFFIVGQTRSGTTTLYHHLKQHPDVFIVHTGSGFTLQFFGMFPTVKTEEEYLKIYSNVKNEKAIGEKNTDTLIDPKSAKQIHQYYPDAKIIINLRNPIDVMLSVHNLMVNAAAVEKITDFEEALAAEKTRTMEELKKPGTHDPFLFYRKTARYIDQVQKYVDVFGLENIHIQIFDDFKKDPLIEFQKICRFLKIDDTFIPVMEHYNKRRISRSKTLQSLVNKTGRTRFRKIVRKVPKIQNAYNLINRPYVNKDQISEGVKMKLKKELKPEIEELSKLIGRDLTFWYK